MNPQACFASRGFGAKLAGIHKPGDSPPLSKGNQQ